MTVGASDSAPTKRIFHITTRDAWTKAEGTAAYRHDSLTHEGFIHCSFRGQVRATWDRVFEGAPGLVVLTIDTARIDAELRVEEGERGECFPHVYGAIPVQAVTALGRPEDF